MKKRTTGETMNDLSVTTLNETGVPLSAVMGGKPAVLLVSRYAGCPLCQVSIAKYRNKYEEIKAKGGELIVVLQSTPESVKNQLGEENLPFPVICDPEKKVYEELGVEKAKNTRKLVGSLKTLPEAAYMVTHGFKHGEYEGEELQLPAVFVVKPDLRLTFAHYGKSVADVPDADAVIKQL